MADPMSDEPLRDQIAGKLAEWAFQAAETKGVKLTSFHRHIIEQEAPERADMVMEVVRPELERLRAELDDAAHTRRRIERERDQMAQRVEQARRAAVVYVERIQEAEAERDRLAEQVKRVEALRDRWEAAVRDPTIYRNGGAQHAAALAASHLPDLRRALDGTEAGT